MTDPKRDFTRLPGGDGYVLSLHGMATELRIERLKRERGVELSGELGVLPARGVPAQPQPA